VNTLLPKSNNAGQKKPRSVQHGAAQAKDAKQAAIEQMHPKISQMALANIANFDM
jgi:hypothetical protein